MSMEQEKDELIQGLIACFEFTDAHEVLDVARHRTGRNDLQGLTMLLAEMKKDAFKKAEKAYSTYRAENPREVAIDRAIQKLAVGG